MKLTQREDPRRGIGEEVCGVGVTKAKGAMVEAVVIGIPEIETKGSILGLQVSGGGRA